MSFICITTCTFTPFEDKLIINNNVVAMLIYLDKVTIYHKINLMTVVFNVYTIDFAV